LLRLWSPPLLIEAPEAMSTAVALRGACVCSNRGASDGEAQRFEVAGHHHDRARLLRRGQCA
jgi:hypothetical protein